MILCGTGDSTTLEKLRSLFPDSERSESRGFSKLHKIVLEILHCDLKLELAKGDIDVDVLDSTGRPALSWAARRGDVFAVDILLKAKANCNIRDGLGKTPFFWALQAPNLACAELLLQYGADATILNNDGQDALYYAAFFHDNIEIIQRIIAAGADVNRATGLGQRALAVAIRQGHFKSAIALLDGGADIDACDSEGDSSLMNSLVTCKYEATAFLLKRGACYTLTNIYGRNILHCTAEGYNSIETLDLLEDAMIKGIDPDDVDKHGKTALQLAQQSKSKPEQYVERFENLLVGIRERNNAGNIKVNDNPKVMDPNASVRCSKDILECHLPRKLCFLWPQAFWKRITGLSFHSTEPVVWLYLFLGLGWIGFFSLLFWPNDADTRVLQSLGPSRADDNNLAKAKLLSHKFVLTSPIPSPVIAATKPTETHPQTRGDDTKQKDKDYEDEELMARKSCNAGEAPTVLQYHLTCPLDISDE